MECSTNVFIYLN